MSSLSALILALSICLACAACGVADIAAGTDASANTKSGSLTIDQTNGTIVEVDGKEYTVTAGDGGDHGDFGQIVDTYTSESTVDPALRGDGINGIKYGNLPVEMVE